MVMIKALFLIALLATIAAKAEPSDENTAEQAFSAGQRMASCSAYFRYGSRVAKDANKPASKDFFDSAERGWKLAAMYMLQLGAKNQKFNAEFTVKSINDTQFTKLLAMEEADPTGTTIVRLKNEECDPLVKLQEAVIQDLRSRSSN